MSKALDIVQAEAKKIVEKYLSMINERLNKARDELMRKIEEIKSIR